MSEEGKAHQPIFCQEKDNFLPTPVRKNYQEKKLWKRKKRKASGKKKASQIMPYEGTIQLTKKYSKKEEEEERITAVKSPQTA